jgi:predicted nucleic acid-binding Zn ribbon protein
MGGFRLADGEYRPYNIALEQGGGDDFAGIQRAWRLGTPMPIYVYERPDGSRFELRQGFNDASLTEDPETGVPVRRVLQPAPVIFKGSGWYKTDSRATPSNGTTETKAPDTAAAADKGEKSEKPAETTSAKEAVSDATAKTTTEIKKTTEKPATPAAAS